MTPIMIYIFVAVFIGVACLVGGVAVMFRPEEGTVAEDRLQMLTGKGKGKSGGGRVITYAVTENKEVYLLTIYDKSEFDSVDDKTLRTIIASLNLEK